MDPSVHLLVNAWRKASSASPGSLTLPSSTPPPPAITRHDEKGGAETDWCSDLSSVISPTDSVSPGGEPSEGRHNTVSPAEAQPLSSPVVSQSLNSDESHFTLSVKFEHERCWR